MWQPRPSNLKMVWETSLPEFNPEEVHLFVAKLSLGRNNSTNFAERVTVPKIWAYHTLSTQTPSCCESKLITNLRTSHIQFIS